MIHCFQLQGTLLVCWLACESINTLHNLLLSPAVKPRNNVSRQASARLWNTFHLIMEPWIK